MHYSCCIAAQLLVGIQIEAHASFWSVAANAVRKLLLVARKVGSLCVLGSLVFANARNCLAHVWPGGAQH